MNNNLNLLTQFIKRDIQARYKGTLIGFGWVFLSPLLLLAVFTLVFNGVFNMKWPHANWDSPFGFALFTFCGLIIHQALSEILTRAPTQIYSQPNLVTKVVFPIWILPASILGSTVIQLIISLVILFAVLTLTHQPYLSWLALPLILAPYLMGLAGLSLVLAALGVYIRDLAQITGFIVVLFMFLSPIFYPLSAVSSDLAVWLSLNPMAHIMEATRDALILGNWPSIKGLLVSWLVSAIVLGLGIYIFNKLQRGFTDVL